MKDFFGYREKWHFAAYQKSSDHSDLDLDTAFISDVSSYWSEQTPNWRIKPIVKQFCVLRPTKAM